MNEKICVTNNDLVNEPNHYNALTGIRAIAAYMVYLYHYNLYPIFTNSILLQDFIQELHIGVSIFFVLSGFLITYRYYNKVDLTKYFFKKYFVNRIARIYPVYFLLTTLTFIYILRYPDYGVAPELPLISKYLFNLIFVRGFLFKIIYSGIGQGWSLTVEECFYIVAPMVIFLMQKQKYMEKRVAIVLIFILVIFLTGVILKEVIPSGRYGFLANYDLFISYTFFGRVFEFGVGILLGALLRQKNKILTNTQINITYTSCFLIIIILCVLVKIRIFYGIAPAIDHFFGKIVNNIFLPFPIAGLIWGLINEKTLLLRLLSTRIAVILGKSSYIFYLIHAGILYQEIIMRINPNSIMNYIYVFIIINIFSIIIYFMFEEPMNRLIRKYNS